MSYNFSKDIQLNFEDTVLKVTEELKKEGFGVLTEIDVQATLKKKLDVDFKKYKILGACNPPFAYKALSVEEKIGVLLPCNVVVQEKTIGVCEVSIINPMETMKSVNNVELAGIADEITTKLKRVLENT